MEIRLSEELFASFMTKSKNNENYYKQIFPYLNESKIIISFSLNKIDENFINKKILIIIN